MNDAVATKPIILKFKNRSYTFEDLSKFSEFAESQEAVWSWLKMFAVNERPLNQTWNIYKGYLEHISHFLKKYPTNKESPDGLIRNLNIVTTTAVKNGFFPSDSLEANFISNLKETRSPKVAGYALAALMQQDIPYNTDSSTAAFEGTFRALQFLEMNKDTLKAGKSEFENLLHTSERKLDEIYKEISEKKEQINDEISLLKKSATAQKKQVQEQKISFEEMLESSKKEIKEFEHACKEKVKMHASVTHWKGKEKNHNNNIKQWRRITFWLATIGTVVFAIIAFSLVKEPITQIPVGQLGAMLAISSFVVWLTRLSAKILISNLHLETDANERVTMIQTYLALLLEGNGLPDNDRQLILQTLFRPSSTGFIKEEGPTGLLDTISKIKEK